MRRMLSIVAAAALAAAPTYAQQPRDGNRTEVPAPNAGQAGGRTTAGQDTGRPGTDRIGNRPVAGRSVPETQVGRVGNEAAAGQVGNRAVAGRGQSAGVNDALFAAAAVDSGLSEVSLSQLGVQRATDPQLKEFSRRMVEEHTRMNRELMALAAQKGMRIPQMVDVRAQFCAQSLASLPDEKFDECYAKAQLIAHMDAIAMFTAEAERGLDPDVRALAARSLGHIKDHYNQLRPIAEKYMKDMEGDAGHGRIGNPGVRPIR